MCKVADETEIAVEQNRLQAQEDNETAHHKKPVEAPFDLPPAEHAAFDCFHSHRLVSNTHAMPPRTPGLIGTADSLTECTRGLMVGAMIAQRPQPAPVETGYRVGDERLIRLTPNAAAKVRTLLAKRASPAGVLRVAVVGGGCSGLTYKLDLQDEPQNRDIVVDSEGIKVVVDSKSAMYVTGSELDYVESLQESGFKFKNPNAASSCSCGESFTT